VERVAPGALGQSPTQSVDPLVDRSPGSREDPGFFRFLATHFPAAATPQSSHTFIYGESRCLCPRPASVEGPSVPSPSGRGGKPGKEQRSERNWVSDLQMPIIPSLRIPSEWGRRSLRRCRSARQEGEIRGMPCGPSCGHRMEFPRLPTVHCCLTASVPRASAPRRRQCGCEARRAVRAPPIEAKFATPAPRHKLIDTVHPPR